MGFLLMLAITCIATVIAVVLGALYLVCDKVSNIPIRNSNFIVTGGSDGLGLALAIDIVKNGGNLIIISRNQSKLTKALGILTKYCNPKQIVGAYPANVEDYDSISSAIEKSVQHLGHLDVLICNAGITHPSRFENMEIGWFERVMRTNYLGTVYSIRSAVGYLKGRGRSRVICVSSLAGLVGIMGYSCYAPTKSAIRTLCECLHQEYYHYGISFSVTFPGSIGTQSFYEVEQRLKPRETLLLEELDAILTPEQISKSILNSLQRWSFLISPSGLNSDLLLIGCGGISPGSFREILSQIVGMGLVKILGCILLTYKAKCISISVRKDEK